MEQPKQIRKKFVGKSSSASTTKTPLVSTNATTSSEPVDPLLLAAIQSLLPQNYNFEIPKTISLIKKNNSQLVALQLPEGLLMYACSIADIIQSFTSAQTVIMGDVTYGACCIDDYTARALGCDLMVHYGHSCLVPVDTTTIKTLYVFVEISVDRQHLAQSVRLNFPECLCTPSTSSASDANSKGKGPALEIELEKEEVSRAKKTIEEKGKPTKLALVGTIQFVAAVQALKVDLESPSPSLEPPRLAIEASSSSSTISTSAPLPDEMKEEKSFEILIPQIKPLSPGEILGCTAPRLPLDIQALIYIGDGRFHLESIMIANPTIPAYRYDPYSKKLTREGYEHEEMRRVRGRAVELARESLKVKRKGTREDEECWGVVLGTLGRQGNLRVLKSITKHLTPTFTSSTSLTTTSPTPRRTPFIPLLLSELSPAKLSLLSSPGHISTFVQTSCPRLSIDWGYAFPRPLLSTYEASLALGAQGARGFKLLGGGREAAGVGGAGEEDYPMDFYADGSMGEWTPRFGMGVRKAGGEKGRPVPRRKKVVPVVEGVEVK
ncbi:hypothetical protein T439DRAFT_303293 [Meredithblackwellia eburnea MCA 4105]